VRFSYFLKAKNSGHFSRRKQRYSPVPNGRYFLIPAGCKRELYRVIYPVRGACQMPYRKRACDRRVIVCNATPAILKLEVIKQHMVGGNGIDQEIERIGTIHGADNLVVILVVCEIVDEECGWCRRFNQENSVVRSILDKTCSVAAGYNLAHIPGTYVLSH